MSGWVFVGSGRWGCEDRRGDCQSSSFGGVIVCAFGYGVLFRVGSGVVLGCDGVRV